MFMSNSQAVIKVENASHSGNDMDVWILSLDKVQPSDGHIPSYRSLSVSPYQSVDSIKDYLFNNYAVLKLGIYDYEQLETARKNGFYIIKASPWNFDFDGEAKRVFNELHVSDANDREIGSLSDDLEKWFSRHQMNSNNYYVVKDEYVVYPEPESKN